MRKKGSPSYILVELPLLPLQGVVVTVAKNYQITVLSMLYIYKAEKFNKITINHDYKTSYRKIIIIGNIAR